MLYGRPLKHIRYSNEQTITLEPQRFFLHKIWEYNSSATARTDGLDLSSTTGAKMPLGSKVTKHKLEILVTPETIEPQQLYIGRIKLSFHDIYSPTLNGGVFNQQSYGGTTNEDHTLLTNSITPHMWPDDRDSGATIQVAGAEATNQEIGGSGSGFGIQEWKLDDNIHHWINLKKVTVFDQRPLMGERFQRIPSKVKRINEGTFYGMFFFNDSVRGATAADTQLTINLKEYIEELAI